ncbi:MAG: peptide chain release factor N(5)-glutamine methyltransferase [Bacteroidales bacterium]|nr:peptide chain release factor N(5)-glutamine methyltransferase [Bacteroidales bacterium]
MTVKEYIDTGIERLLLLYPTEEARALLCRVADFFCGIPAHSYYVDPNLLLPDASLPDLQKALDELLRSRPIQYVLGETFFEGCTLKVSEDVLIPRPETEELVRWAKSLLSGAGSVLDLCTGSGAIAISLAKAFPQAEVYGIDICEEALEIAQENNGLNKVEVHFIKADVLQPPDLLAFSVLSHPFDLIISNPPYVRFSEKLLMRANVLEYEPHQALFVPDDDPLLFYRALADWGALLLKEGGILMTEINEQMGQEVKQLLINKGYLSVKIREDLNNKPRMCYAVKS